MEQAPAALSIALAISVMVSCFVSGWAVTLRRSMPIMPFVLMTAAMALYSAGYLVEINQSTIGAALVAIKLEYLGLAFIPVLLFLVAGQLFWDRPIPRHWLLGLLVIPVVTLALVLTMPAHDLFYVDPRMSDDEFPVLRFERGPWYLVNYGYQTVVLVVSAVLLLRYSRRVRRLSRWAWLPVTVAALLPIAGSLIYFLGLSPDGLDPVPVLLGLSSVAIAMHLFGLHLFDLIPAAREIALDSVSEALVVVDSLGRVRDFNLAATQLPGLSTLATGAAIPVDSPLGKGLRDVASTPGRTVEFSVDGPQGPEHLSASSYRVSDPRHLVTGVAIMVRDITIHRRLVDELAHQAATDDLTGVLTRRAILEGGEALLEQARTFGLPLAVLMLDLDGFKELNDEFGHATGDRALVMVTGMMRSCVRSGDLLGRIGGDEFVILMLGSDLLTAEQVADRMHHQLRGITDSELPRPIRASVGVAVGVPNQGDRLRDYLESADRALYTAKRSGGDRTGVSA